MERFRIKAFDKVHRRIRDVAAVHLIEQAVLLWIDSGNVRATVARDINDVKFIRYTELKDKNGKEIDEGAISWDKWNECYGVVKFDEGKFIYEWENICEDLIEVHDFLEIIGNSYENPELLEVD